MKNSLLFLIQNQTFGLIFASIIAILITILLYKLFKVIKLKDVEVEVVEINDVHIPTKEESDNHYLSKLFSPNFNENNFNNYIPLQNSAKLLIKAEEIKGKISEYYFQSMEKIPKIGEKLKVKILKIGKQEFIIS